MEGAIDDYDPNDVSLLDRDIYGSRLQRVIDLYKPWKELVLSLLSEVDEDIEDERVKFLETTEESHNCSQI